MAFKLTQSPTFKAPVKFQLRGEDGKVIEAGFKGIYQRKTQEEVDAMFAASLSDEKILAETFRGWEDGPLGEDNAPLPFNAENVEKLSRQIHGIKSVLVATFFDNNSAASRKN